MIVEDGSCVAGANALVSRQEFIDYAALYRPGTEIPDDATADGAIVRASLWLSTFPKWKGKPACDCGHGLAWPRTGAKDCDGCAIASDVVPFAVKQATFVAALVELESPGALTPTITPGQQAKREKVDVIEVEYMTPKDQGVPDAQYDPTVALRPVLTQVMDLLRCLATFPGKATPWPWVA